MISLPALNFAPVLPEIILTVGLLLILFIDAFARGPIDRYLGWLGALFAIAAAAASGRGLATLNEPVLGGMIYGGPTGAVGSMWIALVTAATALVTHRFGELRRGSLGALLAMILSSAIGGMLLLKAANLSMLFVALELLSIPLYALAAYDRSSDASTEAGLKYFVLGSVASAILLYGISLVYGATGTMSIEALRFQTSTSPLWHTGWIMILVGLLFKIAIVPLHFWAPDVYQGSPTPVTLFMASAVKIGAFGALFRVMTIEPVYTTLWPLLYGGAVLSIVAGNLLALVQSSVKRMLAYSSIAHAGYVLAALVAGGEAGFAAAHLYLWAYVMMTVGSFTILMWLGDAGGEIDLFDDLGGVATRHPYVAFGTAVLMLSLGGIPPTIGFLGKLQILQALVGSGLIRLAVILVLGSAVGVYFYLRPIVHMYMKPASRHVYHETASPWAYGRITSSFVLTASVLGVLFYGLRATPLARVAERIAIDLLSK